MVKRKKKPSVVVDQTSGKRGLTYDPSKTQGYLSPGRVIRPGELQQRPKTLVEGDKRVKEAEAAVRRLQEVRRFPAKAKAIESLVRTVEGLKNLNQLSPELETKMNRLLDPQTKEKLLLRLSDRTKIPTQVVIKSEK